MLHALLASLSRCIQAHFSDLLDDPWFSVGPPLVLDIKRMCDGIDQSVFALSLWTRDPVCAMHDHIDRLNVAMVMLDQFLELDGGCVGPVSVLSTKIWNSVSSPQSEDLGLKMCEFTLLRQILQLSDPLKLEMAFNLCRSNAPMQLEICRLYADDLDTAVGLLSQQIQLIRDREFASITGDQIEINESKFTSITTTDRIEISN